MFSCRAEESHVAPSNLIPADKMISLIIDLQILETHYSRLFQQPQNYRTALDSASTFVFKKHLVTKPQFDSSFTYYSHESNTIYGIYEAALDSINFRLSQQTR
ncbi:MAG: DUF4296 domain-containing protein [Crocinitomicaceae bacterium]|nr:DUF4296 domain-containing protein [Crocinitomicaceae bacterium]